MNGQSRPSRSATEPRRLRFRNVVTLGAAALVMVGMLGCALVSAPEARAYLSPADEYYISLQAGIGVGPALGVSYEEFALEGRQVAATVAESSDPIATAASLARQIYIHTNLSTDQAIGSVANAVSAYHPEMIPIMLEQGRGRGLSVA